MPNPANSPAAPNASQRNVVSRNIEEIAIAAATTITTTTKRRYLAISLIRRRRGRVRASEAVPNAYHRLNAVATCFEFLSQPANVNIQRARIAVITVAPDLIEQLLTSNHASLLLSQRRQQLKFLMRQLHVLAVA